MVGASVCAVAGDGKVCCLLQVLVRRNNAMKLAYEQSCSLLPVNLCKMTAASNEAFVRSSVAAQPLLSSVFCSANTLCWRAVVFFRSCGVPSCHRGGGAVSCWLDTHRGGAEVYCGPTQQALSSEYAVNNM